MPDVVITGHIEGLGAAEAEVDRVKAALLPPLITESMGLGADIFADFAREFAPKLTGRLAGSIDKHETSATSFAIHPGVDVIYAGVQEDGGIHHGNPLMVFELDGRVVRARTVVIPGTHYMAQAFEAGREPAIETVKQSVLGNI